MPRSSTPRARSGPAAVREIVGHGGFVPLKNATNQIVLTENGGAVDKVPTGGKLVVTGRRAIGVDRVALAAKRFAEGIEPIISDFGRGFVTSLSHGADPYASE